MDSVLIKQLIAKAAEASAERTTQRLEGTVQQLTASLKQVDEKATRALEQTAKHDKEISALQFTVVKLQKDTEARSTVGSSASGTGSVSDGHWRAKWIKVHIAPFPACGKVTGESISIEKCKQLQQFLTEAASEYTLCEPEKGLMIKTGRAHTLTYRLGPAAECEDIASLWARALQDKIVQDNMFFRFTQ